MNGNHIVRLRHPVSGWSGVVETRWGRIDLMKWSMVALVIGTVIWGLADVRRRGRIDPEHPETHRTDFTVYTIAGEAMLYGGDPYAVANLRGWKYVYLPLFALVVAPLGSLDSQTQVLVWFAISVILSWGCLRECVRIAEVVLPGEPRRGVFGPIPTWIGAAAVTAAIVPTLNCLQRGQTGVVVLYFLLLGFRLLGRKSERGLVVIGGRRIGAADRTKGHAAAAGGIRARSAGDFCLVFAWIGVEIISSERELGGSGFWTFAVFIVHPRIGHRLANEFRASWHLGENRGQSGRKRSERRLRRRQHDRTQPKFDQCNSSLWELGGRRAAAKLWYMARCDGGRQFRAADGRRNRRNHAACRSDRRRMFAIGGRLSHRPRGRSAWASGRV